MIAIVDARMPQGAKASLCNSGFSVISLPPFSRLDSPVASHPDMLMLPLGDRLFVHADYCEEASAVLDRIVRESGYTLVPVDTVVAPTYPADIGLNLLVLGKCLIGRTDRAPEEVLAYGNALGLAPLYVKQGYARCSTVALGNNAIITADPSILSAAEHLGIASLPIAAGGVSLSGYEYGFLGGACGVLGNRVYFCGTLESHPNGDEIAAFCLRHGYEIVSLCDRPLLDVGSIFFL